MKTYQAKLMAGCSAISMVLGCGGLAHAQTGAAPEVTEKVETVIVTARRKSEDLLKVPVAIQALTGRDLEKRDIVSLDDVALYTPGLTDDQALGGSARNDRSFQTLIIRGMTPAAQVDPTTSVFINGVYVPSALVQNLVDVDRVEVLEGPQSAYFGRDTFAGAVNIVTKSPPKELGGYVSVEEGTRRTQDYRISVGGPILGDKLSFLANIDYNSHFGSYKNAELPNQYLGSQSTINGSLTIVAKPIDNLTIKAFGQMLSDNDGPAATGVILANQTGSIPNQSNCQVAGSPFFCGTLPRLPSTSPAQSSYVTPAIAQFLAAPGKLISPGSSVDGYGLFRKSYDFTLNVDYLIPSLGLTLSSLSGFAYDDLSAFSDLSNLDSNATGLVYGAPYTGFPFMAQARNRDFSQEFRVTTDQTKPYRATLGVSYLQSRTQSGLGGPEYGGFYSIDQGSGEKTSGIFFSLAYDILPKLTVTFDGRYQYDDVSSYDDATDKKAYEAHFYNWLPRASVQYKFTPDVMGYFTYSEGVNSPQGFNTQLASLPTVDQTYFKQNYGGGVVISPEKISNYELGVKGRFFDGRASVSADVYYDKWTDQLQSTSFNVFANNTVGLVDPTAPAVDLIGFVGNGAKSTAKGVEVNGQIIPIEHVNVNFAGAINDTKYDSGAHCIPCASYPSTTLVNADGNYLPNASKYSGTIGVEYANTLNFFSATDWFVRVDYVYKSGFYLEEENIEKTPDQNLVNLRGGVNWQKFRLEGYVTNLFNDKAYTSGFADVNFANFPAVSYNAIYVGLPNLVTVGARLKYSF